jgi:SAM-dependent methyltransferase
MSATITPAPKPEFWSEPYAKTFQDAQVAEAYQYRPVYPPETFTKLSELIVDFPRHVLDLGCGTGALARYMVDFSERVDAVDFSAAMIERGKQLPNGDSPKLNWLVGRAEEVALDPPYALATAGDSLHWMDWETLLPRIGALLSPHGKLAILTVDALPQAWENELRQLIRKFSTMRTFRNISLFDELAERDLFTPQGTSETAPFAFSQTIDEYIESFHARASLAHGHMAADQSAAFDHELRKLIGERDSSRIELQLVAKITWGIPHAPGEKHI